MIKPYRNTTLSVDNAIRSDFDINALLEADFVRRNNFGHWYYHGTKLLEIFTDEWLDYIKETTGMHVGSSIIFYRPNNKYVHAAVPHVDNLDTNKENYLISINWLLSEPDATGFMIWHETPSAPGMDLISPDGADYKVWDTNTVFTEVARYSIGKEPVLARVDIPHSIQVGSLPRLSMVVRLVPNDKNNLTWEKVLQLCSQFIK